MPHKIKIEKLMSYFLNLRFEKPYANSAICFK